jgi:carbon-monoxide dehydrogenase medium subunit
MKPPPFSYHDPRTVADAVGLLGKLENAKLLAGGQSLMPMLNMRYVLPDHVIDLNRIEGLSYIRETGGAIEIGAMTRQRELEFSDLIHARLPLMQEAIFQIGHRQTRNRGTIGGSLAHLDPAAELVTLGAGFDATVVVTGPNGPREIAFADFPVAYMTPAIEPNEILTAVRFTPWPAGHGFAFVEFSRRHGDFAITSAAVLLTADDRRRRRDAGARARGGDGAHRPDADAGADARGVRELPRHRGDRGHPRAGELPPASRRRAVAPRAGEGGHPHRPAGAG